MDYEQNSMIRVAWLYYKEGLTQQQISDTMGITRMRVIKYLDKARLMNVVQFQVNLTAQRHLTLQNEIASRYQLKEVYIVPTSPNDINNTVGMAAAQYVKGKMESASRFALNIGYGDTISKTLRHLDIPAEQDFSLVSLTGGVSYYVHPQSQYGRNNNFPIKANTHIIPAPLCASTAEAAHCFLQEPSVRHVMEMSQLADMTIIGIGGVTRNATMVREGIITDHDISMLQMRGAVGDILSQYFNKDGERVDFPTHARLVANDLQTLRQFKNVVGIAGGLEKVPSILGALNGGYLNVLITDEDTAIAIQQNV